MIWKGGDNMLKKLMISFVAITFAFLFVASAFVTAQTTNMTTNTTSNTTVTPDPDLPAGAPRTGFGR